jgi:hypothetical protein
MASEAGRSLSSAGRGMSWINLWAGRPWQFRARVRPESEWIGDKMLIAALAPVQFLRLTLVSRMMPSGAGLNPVSAELCAKIHCEW